MQRQIRLQVSLFGADRAKTVLRQSRGEAWSTMDFQNSCALVVLTPLLRVPTQERPSQVSSHLEPHRRLAQVGSVAWFLSCGPMKVEPSHPRWRLGNWGAASPQPSLAGHPYPGQPGAWLTVLAAGWIQAGPPRTRLGSGYQGPGCLTFTPTSDDFIQVLLSSLP